MNLSVSQLIFTIFKKQKNSVCNYSQGLSGIFEVNLLFNVVQKFSYDGKIIIQ